MLWALGCHGSMMSRASSCTDGFEEARRVLDPKPHRIVPMTTLMMEEMYALRSVAGKNSVAVPLKPSRIMNPWPHSAFLSARSSGILNKECADVRSIEVSSV
jgi:hypothetical protein